jgi:4-aminobutyrate aminotransferase-like enzyme
VVVDDGSSADEFRRIAEIAGRDQRIRVLKHPGPRRGASACRNAGLAGLHGSSGSAVNNLVENFWAIKDEGRKYIEYGMGLRAVALGHACEFVTEAAYRQMRLGSNFTRPATIELECAEKSQSLRPPDPLELG